MSRIVKNEVSENAVFLDVSRKRKNSAELVQQIAADNNFRALQRRKQVKNYDNDALNEKHTFNEKYHFDMNVIEKM